VSGANEYSVNPLALVSTVAPPMVAVFRPPAVAAAGVPVLVLPPPVEDVADELHAASTAVAAPTASSAGNIRRRLPAFSRVSDVIIAFSLLLDPPGPLRRGTLTIPPCYRRCRASGLVASAPTPSQPPSQPHPQAACYPEAA